MDFIWSLNGRQNTKYNFSLFFIKLPDPATDPLAIQQIISCYLCLMIRVGEFNMLKIIREASNGVYLDDGGEGLLLPKRVVPEGAKTGDELKVFIYHDKEGRPIATTLKPKGVVGDILRLRVTGTSPHGAFLDNGLMKDLFVPRNNQFGPMMPGHEYLVKIYIDRLSGRMVAMEKLDPFLSNETLTVKVLDEADLIVYRKTPIGYVVIINQKHTGVLHQNEIYRDLRIGDKMKGYIKNISTENTIDVVLGARGYQRVEEGGDQIIRLLQEHGGYLPYHDKSDPDEIYSFFGMSKKTYKMALGALYKQKKISLENAGIRLITASPGTPST